MEASARSETDQGLGQLGTMGQGRDDGDLDKQALILQEPTEPGLCHSSTLTLKGTEGKESEAAHRSSGSWRQRPRVGHKPGMRMTMSI